MKLEELEDLRAAVKEAIIPFVTEMAQIKRQIKENEERIELHKASLPTAFERAADKLTKLFNANGQRS